MAHFALLWKARTIEKYRQNYENEKFLSIQDTNTPLPQKSLSQRLRCYRQGTQKRFSNIFQRIYPEGSSLSNFFLYLRTDQTCLNFVLKSLLGFLIGLALTYLCFLFLVFQLSISLFHATTVSSIIGILLTMGLAFSYRIRCLIFLLLPQFFSRAGRYTLTCYALVLILTGPATNTLKNSEVLSESMACRQEQIKTLVNEVKQTMGKPLNSMRDSIKVMVQQIRLFAKQLKQVLLKVNRLTSSVLETIKSTFTWMQWLSDICNKIMGPPYNRCMKVLKGNFEYKRRYERIIAQIKRLSDKTNEVCSSVKKHKGMCVFTDFVNGSFVATIKRRLKNFAERIKDMLYLQIHVHHSYSFSSNTSHSASQVAAGIVTEIRKRADPLLTWLSWSSCVTSLFLLLIIFRAKYYQHMFETRSRFDNKYITKELRDLDLSRLREGRETILPLNKRERSKYISTTSFRLVASEKFHLNRSIVFMGITTFKLLIHMIADYSLYWVLTTIRFHGKNQTPMPYGVPNAGMHISGTGRIADMFRSLLMAISSPLETPQPLPTACLPDPHPPDFQRYTQIGFLIFLLWFFSLFEPYGLRLRHVVMGLYRPERAKARAEWLYSHILRTRGGFMKFARRKLHRSYKYCSEEKYTFKRWLNDHIPFQWLRFLLGISIEQIHCLLCGTTQLANDPNSTLIRCNTANCPGRYCNSCFSDIGELCTICLSPSDYGDLSDVSLEKGSSDESDDDSDEGSFASNKVERNEEYIFDSESDDIFLLKFSKNSKTQCTPNISKPHDEELSNYNFKETENKTQYIQKHEFMTQNKNEMSILDVLKHGLPEVSVIYLWKVFDNAALESDKINNEISRLNYKTRLENYILKANGPYMKPQQSIQKMINKKIVKKSTYGGDKPKRIKIEKVDIYTNMRKVNNNNNARNGHNQSEAPNDSHASNDKNEGQNNKQNINYKSDEPNKIKGNGGNDILGHKEIKCESQFTSWCCFRQFSSLFCCYWHSMKYIFSKRSNNSTRAVVKNSISYDKNNFKTRKKHQDTRIAFENNRQYRIMTYLAEQDWITRKPVTYSMTDDEDSLINENTEIDTVQRLKQDIYSPQPIHSETTNNYLKSSIIERHVLFCQDRKFNCLRSRHPVKDFYDFPYRDDSIPTNDSDDDDDYKYLNDASYKSNKPASFTVRQRDTITSCTSLKNNKFGTVELAVNCFKTMCCLKKTKNNAANKQNNKGKKKQKNKKKKQIKRDPIEDRSIQFDEDDFANHVDQKNISEPTKCNKLCQEEFKCIKFDDVIKENYPPENDSGECKCKKCKGKDEKTDLLSPNDSNRKKSKAKLEKRDPQCSEDCTCKKQAKVEKRDQPSPCKCECKKYMSKVKKQNPDSPVECLCKKNIVNVEKRDTICPDECTCKKNKAKIDKKDSLYPEEFAKAKEPKCPDGCTCKNYKVKIEKQDPVCPDDCTCKKNTTKAEKRDLVCPDNCICKKNTAKNEKRDPLCPDDCPCKKNKANIEKQDALSSKESIHKKNTVIVDKCDQHCPEECTCKKHVVKVEKCDPLCPDECSCKKHTINIEKCDPLCPPECACKKHTIKVEKCDPLCPAECACKKHTIKVEKCDPLCPDECTCKKHIMKVEKCDPLCPDECTCKKHKMKVEKCDPLCPDECACKKHKIKVEKCDQLCPDECACKKQTVGVEKCDPLCPDECTCKMHTVKVQSCDPLCPKECTCKEHAVNDINNDSLCLNDCTCKKSIEELVTVYPDKYSSDEISKYLDYSIENQDLSTDNNKVSKEVINKKKNKKRQPAVKSANKESADSVILGCRVDSGVKFNENICTCAIQCPPLQNESDSFQDSSSTSQEYTSSYDSCTISIDCDAVRSDFTGTDTTVHQVYIERSRRRGPRIKIISRCNQCVGTDSAIKYNVATITDERSLIRENRFFNTEKKRKHGIPENGYRRDRGVCTKKLVAFKSRPQLIPSRYRYPDVYTPSRYLLESQRYYNELFRLTNVYPQYKIQKTSRQRTSSFSSRSYSSRQGRRVKRLKDLSYGQRIQKTSRKRTTDPVYNKPKYRKSQGK